MKQEITIVPGINFIGNSLKMQMDFNGRQLSILMNTLFIAFVESIKETVQKLN
jgi:hypothetical protein